MLEWSVGGISRRGVFAGLGAGAAAQLSVPASAGGAAVDTRFVEDFEAHRRGEDWAPAIQKGMDTLADKGGGYLRFRQCGERNPYRTGPLFWREGVMLDGGGRGGEQVSAAWLRPFGLPNDGFLLDQDPRSGTARYGMIGLGMMGDGSGGTTGAARARGVQVFVCAHCHLTNWSRQALQLNGGLVQVFGNALNGWNNAPLARAPVGVLELSGADNWVCNNEIAGPSVRAVSGPELFVAAASFRGNAVSLVQGNIFECGDVGVSDLGDINRYIANRYDTNAGHGLYARSGSDNCSVGEYWGRNSFALGADNRFDHLVVPADGAIKNQFIAPQFYSSQREDGSWAVPRYVINDARTGAWRNHYLFPAGIAQPTDDAGRRMFGTSFYNLPSPEGAGVTLAAAPLVELAPGPAPSVLNGSLFGLSRFAPGTTIARLGDAFPGQTITLLGSRNVALSEEAGQIELAGHGPVLALADRRTVSLLNLGSSTRPHWLLTSATL